MLVETGFALLSGLSTQSRIEEMEEELGAFVIIYARLFDLVVNLVLCLLEKSEILVYLPGFRSGWYSQCVDG